jgi:hypothetical protein
MDVLIRWMIALSWTAAGVSSSFVMYTYYHSWGSHYWKLAQNDLIENPDFLRSFNSDPTSPFDQEFQAVITRKELRMGQAQKLHTTGYCCWITSTVLFIFNAIGLIVIHKKGFNPGTKAAVMQTPSPPLP